MQGNRFARCLLGLAAATGIASPVLADVTLRDGNSEVRVITTSPVGMYRWIVDGVNHMGNQWFWYRVGSTDGELSLDTLPIDFEGATDSNFDSNPDRLFVRYLGDGLKIEVTYTLTGGTPGSGRSNISEQIRITNTGTSELDLHFFQFNDFDLMATTEGDSVEIVNGNTARQREGNFLLSEAVVTPQPSHAQAAAFPDIRNELVDTAPTTLSDVLTAGPGDVTWAFQWDILLGANETFTISKTKSIQVVPAPGALLLGLMGVGGLRWMRRRLA